MSVVEKALKRKDDDRLNNIKKENTRLNNKCEKIIQDLIKKLSTNEYREKITQMILDKGGKEWMLETVSDKDIVGKFGHSKFEYSLKAVDGFHDCVLYFKHIYLDNYFETELIEIILKKVK